jgi:LDH2 family malate/lactate/ureidoglycolate dehydrogenase
MTQHATGTFEVKTTPPDSAFKTEDNCLGRMSTDKQFHGDIEAASQGEMLTAGSPVKGSGACVAIERVSGALHGRSGTFILQHSGTMSHGAFQLDIKVVPDSGAGQLQGLTRSMNIIIKDGKRSYDFAYTLAESK